MSLGADYFEELYGASPDPWGLAERWYEERKYRLTLASLPRRRYRSGFEPGCSIGVLTALLAQRCDALLATDVAEAALDKARARVPSSVRLERRTLPAQWPEERFDLVVMSEVGYYLEPGVLGEVAARCATSLSPDGHLVAVHWRRDVADYPSTAEQVHAALRAEPGLLGLAIYAEERFVLEVFGSAAAGAPGLPDPEDGAADGRSPAKRD